MSDPALPCEECRTACAVLNRRVKADLAPYTGQPGTIITAIRLCERCNRVPTRDLAAVGRRIEWEMTAFRVRRRMSNGAAAGEDEAKRQ